MTLYKKQLFFIFLLISTTTVDYVGRKLLFGKSDLLLNTGVFFLFLLSLIFFLSILKEINSDVENSHVKQVNKNNAFSGLFNNNDPLLVIRFFAAFLVFVTHMTIVFGLLTPKGASNLITGHWFFLQGAAHTGMTIFFTLSGFLMGKAFVTERYKLTKKGILSFYQSRWVRIVPLMFFVFIFEGVLQYPQLLRFEFFSAWRLLFFSYYGENLTAPGIGAMWSLSVEFQYYLICPFIFGVFNSIAKRNKNLFFLTIYSVVALIVILKILATVYVFREHDLQQLNFFSLFGNMPYFLIGFSTNYIRLRINKKFFYILNNNLSVLMIITFFYLVCCLGEITGRMPYYVLASVLTAFVIYWMEESKQIKRPDKEKKLLSIKVFQGLGVLSYGFYLWHSGVAAIHAELFPDIFINQIEYIKEIFIIGVIVLGVSLITYILVEERFNKYKAIYK